MPVFSNDYDLVKLCHHIEDEHQLDANIEDYHEAITVHIQLQIQLLFFELDIEN